jgi:NAD/NADP transhydrogenase beta subunit
VASLVTVRVIVLVVSDPAMPSEETMGNEQEVRSEPAAQIMDVSSHVPWVARAGWGLAVATAQSASARIMVEVFILSGTAVAKAN